MATGSYEGSLPAEGTPDHHEASAFTRRRGRWSRRQAHPPTRAKPPPPEEGTGRTARLQQAWRRPRREGENRQVATGVSEARSHRPPWEENAHARDEGREARSTRAVIDDDPPKRPEVSWNTRSPGQSDGAPDSVGRPRGESCESEPGTREVRVHMIRLGGRNRSDASRVFSTGRLQGLLVSKRGR